VEHAIEPMKNKTHDEFDRNKSNFAAPRCRYNHPISKTTPFADISEGVGATKRRRGCNPVRMEKGLAGVDPGEALRACPARTANPGRKDLSPVGFGLERC